MSLYKLNDLDICDYDDHLTINRRKATKIFNYINIYFIRNNKFPNCYLNYKSYYFLGDLPNFTYSNLIKSNNNFIGYLNRIPCYISYDLENDEFFIGLNEREIKIHKRRKKLNKIIEKMS